MLDRVNRDFSRQVFDALYKVVVRASTFMKNNCLDVVLLHELVCLARFLHNAYVIFRAQDNLEECCVRFILLDENNMWLTI